MGDHHPEPRRPGRTTGSSVLTPPTGIPVIPDDAAALLVPPPGDVVAVPCAEPAPAPAPAPATPTPTPTPAEVAAPATSCLCGHEAAAHEHWRRGSDCGACGGAACPSFRRRGGALRRLLRAVLVR